MCWNSDGTKRKTFNKQMLQFGKSHKIYCLLKLWKSLMPIYYWFLNQSRHLISSFQNLIWEELYFQSKISKTLVVFIGHFSALPLLGVMVQFLFLRLQQRSIERAMCLTDSFTWEDLPTRDADTGHLSAAGWVPLTMKYSVRVAIAGLSFHIVQSTIRMLKKHETLIIAWYPFDWTVSPFYELVNISQVTISVDKS